MANQKTGDNDTKDVIRYYADTQVLYDDHWSKNHMHYGFWYPETKNHEEALTNNVEEICQLLEINENDKLLDAGCGVGGACRYIALRYSCEEINGITISPLQVEMAQEKTPSELNKINYFEMDYHSTEFDSKSIDKVYSIESVCHSNDKTSFLEEMYRLLSPRGKIVIADYFLVRNFRTSKEKDIYNDWMKGWAMPNLAHIRRFLAKMKNIGYQNVYSINKTQEIFKTSKHMKTISFRNKLINYIPSKLGIVPKSWYKNAVASVNQFKLLKSGLWQYFIVVAEK